MLLMQITQRYDGTDATLEILSIVLISLVLGYLLRYFLDRGRLRLLGEAQAENERLKARIDTLETELTRALNGAAQHSADADAAAQLRQQLAALEATMQQVRAERDRCSEEVTRLRAVAHLPFFVAAADGATADDLTRIEGIGPKIEGLLNEAGIHTFGALARTDAEHLRDVILAADERYRIHKPDTWPRQAALAASGEWEILDAWQEKLRGGVEAD